jgi:hypothetical protein
MYTCVCPYTYVYVCVLIHLCVSFHMIVSVCPFHECINVCVSTASFLSVCPSPGCEWVVERSSSAGGLKGSSDEGVCVCAMHAMYVAYVHDLRHLEPTCMIPNKLITDSH